MDYKVETYATDQVFSKRSHGLKVVIDCEVLRYVETYSDYNV